VITVLVCFNVMAVMTHEVTLATLGQHQVNGFAPGIAQVKEFFCWVSVVKRKHHVVSFIYPSVANNAMF
jgi:hypothetical protein